MKNRPNMASSSEESRFLEQMKRKRVKITLSDTEISGVIQKITQKKTLILEDVSEVKSGRRFPGAKLIFGNEIIKMEFPVSAGQDSVFSNDKHKSEFQTFKKKTILDSEKDSVRYVLIDELHEKFGPAIMHIQEQDVIGIGADVYGQSGQERLCWLQVATKKVVYLFDILLLGGQVFKNGLSMILENTHILKVLHDCRCITRCLKAEFRVQLTNVFDTQVAELLLFFSESGGFLPDRLASLPELLQLHLRLTTAEIQPLCSKQQQSRECVQLWYMRPCPPDLLSLMCSSVQHLLSLRLLLLDALLADYTVLVDSIMSSSHCPPLHFQQDESVVLPELQELMCVRQQRMDWASRCYSQTASGLLLRSSFKAPSHTPAEAQ
ncbi:piRNA biogenesis protein EXD1 [Danio aesculapii]|uniref:piRNA biogenesis protein EXD1 n=1 Tax=Danio aesculapii TaxID=1142201 RepID=UPI0024C088E2|nr:piRNA biogenesis protein EXD1 [Danio aesculapii]